MTDPFDPIPKRSRPVWDPRLEPLDGADEPGVELPLLGRVSAGQPAEAVEDAQTLRVPARLVHRRAAGRSFALRVRGRSMTDDEIRDGDIVVVEGRPTAENGETVVALIGGDEVTLKRFYRDLQGIRLQPANPEMEPLRPGPAQVQILGVVSGVVRGG